MLTREEIRAFYDRFGTRQDWQGFYEYIAMRDLIVHRGEDLPEIRKDEPYK